MTAATLLIAFPKGRLGDELVPKLAGTPLALDAAALKSRVLRIPTATPGVAALLLKGADLPRYVAAGVGSLGIVGSDTLDELDFDFEFSVDTEKATEAWLTREGLTAELVPLSSSAELAPLLGLADAIVDLVQTGGTLKAHGLVETAVLGRSSARLVAARGAYLSEPARLRPLAQALITALRGA